MHCAHMHVRLVAAYIYMCYTYMHVHVHVHVACCMWCLVADAHPEECGVPPFAWVEPLLEALVERVGARCAQLERGEHLVRVRVRVRVRIRQA